MNQHTINNADAQPVCSICIANYNGEEYICDCIQSVLDQDFAQPIQIIVHDDASRDNSVAIIKDKYPQVELLLSDKNIGFCASNNRMVNIAKGEYILLLNNDAFLRPNALQTLFDASLAKGRGIYGLPQYNAETKELIDIGSLLDPFLNSVPNLDPDCNSTGMLTGACLWLPKSLWEELTGFPEWFESLAEDLYLCCLARLKGYRLEAIGHSGYDHLVGTSLGGGKVHDKGNLATTVRRRALTERNKTFVMIITVPGPIAHILVPFHLTLLLLEGLLLGIVKGKKNLFLQIYWNCIAEAWKTREKLLATRKSIQSTRTCSITEFFEPFTWIPYKLKMLFKHGLPSVSD